MPKSMPKMSRATSRAWIRTGLACLLLAGLMLPQLNPVGEAHALDDEAMAAFQELDEDGDQRISATEFKVNKTRIFFMSRAGKDQPGLRFEETLVTRAEFDAADANKDGSLSSLEWITAPFTDFARIDTNSDQAVTMEEFEAFAKAVLR